WQSSFAALFGQAVVFVAHGAAEDLTRRLPGEQSCQRAKGFVDLSIELRRYAAATPERLASTPRPPRTRSIPSSHDTPGEELQRLNVGNHSGRAARPLADVRPVERSGVRLADAVPV